MKSYFKIFLSVLLALVAVILINAIASVLYFRIDLTAEKRYTLSDITKQKLDNLQDSIVFKVFLEGDLPISFQRMKKETNDLLNDISTYSDGLIEFEFIDPMEGDTKSQESTKKFLSSHGIIPYTIQEKDEDGKSIHRLIFPGAIASNGKKAVSFNIFKGSMMKLPEEAIHESIQNLEYELVNTIERLSITKKPKLGFLYGHDELKTFQVYDISISLKEYYEVNRIKINEDLSILKDYSILVIAKPQKAFTEIEKFAIDQFIMNGGRVLWLLDYAYAPVDSLAYQSAIMASPIQLNLQDQLFKYGIRINYNILLDNQCASIPINIAPEGAPAQFNQVPWYYSPLMRPAKDHIITNNLSLIRSNLVSVLDTVNSRSQVKKKVLLQSSKYAKVVSLPVPISFDILNQKPNEQFFNNYDLILGVLLEGTFESLYQNRDVSTFKTLPGFSFNENSKPSIQAVVADGDIIKNDISMRGLDTMPFPLGYDKFTRQTYGNKDFILNLINYMGNNKEILQLRSREYKIRLLNKNRVHEEKLLWQIINVALPLFLILLFGIIYTILRKRKYTVN